jgi:hypothetical protein
MDTHRIRCRPSVFSYFRMDMCSICIYLTDTAQLNKKLPYLPLPRCRSLRRPHLALPPGDTRDDALSLLTSRWPLATSLRLRSRATSLRLLLSAASDEFPPLRHGSRRRPLATSLCLRSLAMSLRLLSPAASRQRRVSAPATWIQASANFHDFIPFPILNLLFFFGL